MEKSWINHVFKDKSRLSDVKHLSDSGTLQVFTSTRTRRARPNGVQLFLKVERNDMMLLEWNAEQNGTLFLS